jgi:maltose alpha-D-glucosyltransferase / alpha-amylase
LPMPPLMLSMALTTAIPDLATQVLGSFLQFVERLGDRTAQLHLALAADTDNPAFAPEPFTLFYQRSIYQYMRDQAGKNLLRLRKEMKHFPEASQQLAQSLLTYEYALMERYRRILENGITTTRIRCHGNYHLEEVLYTGKDFVMVDFEGEATRSLSERRMKRSPLRDVAGLMESLYYAAQVALRREVETGAIRSESLPRMEEWTKFLSAWASLAFLQQYLKTAGTASFIPPSEMDLQVLLEAFLLEKAIYEMDYELDHRPDWLNIPLKRVLELLGIGA